MFLIGSDRRSSHHTGAPLPDLVRGGVGGGGEGSGSGEGGSGPEDFEDGIEEDIDESEEGIDIEVDDDTSEGQTSIPGKI